MESAVTGDDDLLQAADGHFDAGRYAEAAEAYQLALDAGANEAAARYGLAISAAALGRTSDATREFRAVLLLDPGHANAAYQLGVLAEMRSQPQEALRWYRQAAIWNPRHANAQRAIARLDTAVPSAPPLSPGPEPAQPAAAGPAPVPPASKAPVRTLAEELGSKEFDPTLIPHGELLSTRHGRLLRSYAGWLTAPLLVYIVTLVPQPLIDEMPSASAEWVVTEVKRVAQSLALPLLSCVVGLALLSWVTTIYWVYERRIDVLQGIFRRRQRTLWLYEVAQAPRYQQSLLQVLTGTGTIVLESHALPARLGIAPGQMKIGALHLRSLAPINEVKRRSMLDRFIGG
jgi:tetratricopeptide (TPR) repeat protein